MSSLLTLLAKPPFRKSKLRAWRGNFLTSPWIQTISTPREMRPSGTTARWAPVKSLTEVFFDYLVVCLTLPVSLLFSGCWQHDVRSLQLQHPAESSICIPSSGAVLCGPEGGGRTAGEEIPRHGHPGAPSPHRAHTDPSAEESKEQSISTDCFQSVSHQLIKNLLWIWLRVLYEKN